MSKVRDCVAYPFLLVSQYSPDQQCLLPARSEHQLWKGWACWGPRTEGQAIWAHTHNWNKKFKYTQTRKRTYVLISKFKVWRLISIMWIHVMSAKLWFFFECWYTGPHRIYIIIQFLPISEGPHRTQSNNSISTVSEGPHRTHISFNFYLYLRGPTEHI